MYTLKGISFQGIEPQIDEEAFVAPQVFLSGDVRVARYASFWPGAVARGDVSYISVGECSNVQDLVCLHVADDAPCIIGDYVTIGHGAVIPGAFHSRQKTCFIVGLRGRGGMLCHFCRRIFKGLPLGKVRHI